MLIIFEGPDGSGKSTLAEAVQKRLDATRVHHGPPVAGNAHAQWSAAVQLADTHLPVVIDRLHWGDPVYAPIYRPEVGEQLGVSGFHAMNELIRDQGGIIVYVTADVKALTERFDGEYIQTSDLDRLCKAYEMCYLLSKETVPIVTIDTSFGFEVFDEWVDMIIRHANAAWFGSDET